MITIVEDILPFPDKIQNMYLRSYVRFALGVPQFSIRFKLGYVMERYPGYKIFI